VILLEVASELALRLEVASELALRLEVASELALRLEVASELALLLEVVSELALGLKRKVGMEVPERFAARGAPKLLAQPPLKAFLQQLVSVRRCEMVFEGPN
jgi:hypothetical protein